MGRVNSINLKSFKFVATLYYEFVATSEHKNAPLYNYCKHIHCCRVRKSYKTTESKATFLNHIFRIVHN